MSNPERLARAAACLHQNQLAPAEALLAEEGREEPRPAEWFHLVGVLRLCQGQAAAALSFLEQAVTRDPNHAHAWNNRGVALRSLGRVAEAEGCHRRASEIDPQAVDFIRNRATCLQALQRHAEAEPLLRELASSPSAGPQDAFAHAASLSSLGQTGEAIEVYRRILTANPGYWPAAVNLATLLHRVKAVPPAEVEQLYRNALAQHPDEPAILYNLSNLLAERGPIPEVEALLRAAVGRQPAFTEAWINLADHLRLRQRLSEAEQAARRALALDPSRPHTWNLLGAVLIETNAEDEAEACYRKALELQPGLPEALLNLAHLLRRRGKSTEAESCYRQVLAKQPEDAEACNGFGLLCAEVGRFEEGILLLQQAVDADPRNARMRGNLLFMRNYLGLAAPAELLEEARCWEQCLQGVKRLPPRVPRRERLRIGYLSPDFRRHAVAYFIEPVLAAHDPAKVEVFCYAHVPAPDNATERLRRIVREWHSIHTLGDDEVAALVRHHEIDVLVDLAGHTRGNRLAVFARKPAPVQATWLGYFATTGLSSMDYWITDTVLHPDLSLAGFADAQAIHGRSAQWRGELCEPAQTEGRGIRERPGVAELRPPSSHGGIAQARARQQAGPSAESEPARLPPLSPVGPELAQCRPSSPVGPDLGRRLPPSFAAEELWRLPRCYVCYQAPPEAPEVACATDPGTITFGSFNNLAKLSLRTLRLWAAVLRAVPDSRLYLKTARLDDPVNQARLLRVFADEGVLAERLCFEGKTPRMSDHLACYARMDIALDSFPFTGATTTADTLWMGVPVVSLAGSTFSSRMSATMLTAAGCADWIVADDGDHAFVAKATALAEEWRSLPSSGRLARRQALRARVARSELCDGPGMARALEAAFAEMVRKAPTKVGSYE